MQEFSHTDREGKARMVDVSAKDSVLRIARAGGFIRLSASTIQLIRENTMKKGDVLTVAEVAGIMGGKKTSELIPLCHPLSISRMEVLTEIKEDGIEVIAEARCVGPTGIEMEALTAVSVALLTVYDMCKAVDHSMVIENVHLLSKTKESQKLKVKS